MTGVMSLTILLPSIPTYLGQHLSVIFDVFSHLVAFGYKKPGKLIQLSPVLRPRPSYNATPTKGHLSYEPIFKMPYDSKILLNLCP